MHGVEAVGELGADLDGYHERFALHYRNGHALQPDELPARRRLNGEQVRDVIVEVSKPDDVRRWTRVVRGVAMPDATMPGGGPAFCVLILNDVTEEFSAEKHFEQAFAANPAPALICRLVDHRYIKVSDVFLEMTGCQGEMETPRPDSRSCRKTRVCPV